MLLAQIGASLLYLAACLAVAGAAHRWIRPLSRRAVAALLLLPLCFTGRALLGGEIYSPITSAYADPPFEAASEQFGIEQPQTGRLLDLFGQIVPWHRTVRLAWAEGEWPLRNPFILSGDLLAGTAQPAPFYPPNLLSLLLPLPLALTFLASFHFFLAALAAFLFTREIGCRERAAIFGAAGWMAMNGTVFWIGWPIGAVMPLLPLVLLGARRLAREPGPRSCLLLGTVFGVGALAGHPETSVHHLFIGGVYGLWEALRLTRSERRPNWHRHGLQILGWGAAGAALALGLSAVALLPLADALPQTFQWFMRKAIVSPGAESLEEVRLRLLPCFVPFVHGLEGNRVAGLPRFLAAYAGPYAGSLLFVLAAYGLWRSRWPGRWLLLVLGLVGLAAWVRLPGYYEALGRLPLLDTAINHRLVVLAGLAVALLAALGVEAWYRRGRPSGLGRLAALGLVLLAAALAALWPTMRAGGLSLEFLGIQSALYLLPVAAAVPFLLVGRLRRIAPAVLLGLLLIQRVGEIGGAYPTVPVKAFYPPIAPLDSPRLDEGTWRVVGWGSALIPNQGVHYRLEDVRGYQAVHHRHYRRLRHLWTAGEPGGHFYRVDDLSRPFLSFLNVRWALVPSEVRPKPPWRLEERAHGVGLWRNPRALERAFLPERVRLATPQERTVREMEGARDFSSVAWIDTRETLFAQPFEVPNGHGEVEIERRGFGYRLRADLDSPAWVVISEVAWRGWRAHAGGRALPLERANLAFLALHLPGGEHAVDLTFRPRAFDVGLGISGGTLGVLTLLLIGRAWRTRRRRLAAGGPG